jgi:hypothetical protein
MHDDVAVHEFWLSVLHTPLHVPVAAIHSQLGFVAHVVVDVSVEHAAPHVIVSGLSVQRGVGHEPEVALAQAHVAVHV